MHDGNQWKHLKGLKIKIKKQELALDLKLKKCKKCFKSSKNSENNIYFENCMKPSV